MFLQLRDPGYQDRVGMWSLFATLIHEFLHLVTHPNYDDAANAIGGGSRDILVEGMDEHMKTQVWNSLRPRIAADIVAPHHRRGPVRGRDPHRDRLRRRRGDRHQDPERPL